MEIQTRVAPAELWLRDDLEEVYALLFRFLGFGFRLAMSNVGWHVTQKFVILVPDLIAFAPWPMLLDPGEPCDICQHTLLPGHPLRGFLSQQGTRTTVPTDQLSHNHCDCTDSHCNSHIVLPFVPSPIHKSIGGRSSSATSSRRRSAGRSRRVAAASRRSGRSARRAGPREARFVHVMYLARQSRAMVFVWWNPCIIRPYCAADGGAGGAGPREARFVISQDNHIDFVLFGFSPCERAILRQPVDGCGGAGSRALQVRMCCSISCVVRHVSRKVFCFACT